MNEIVIIENDPAPKVTLKDGLTVTNTRHVADYFGKRHEHILDKVDELLAMGLPNYWETPYIHPQNGQTYRAFDMDRDGFTLLAMGFTGPKALKFKLAYIEQFDAMEAELKKPKSGEMSKDEFTASKGSNTNPSPPRGGGKSPRARMPTGNG